MSANSVKSVLIVGGYGNVGGQVARFLATEPRVYLIIGGRSLSKAQALADSINGKAIAIDLDSVESVRSALAGVDIVLNCFSGPFTGYNLYLPETAIEMGVDYLDVTGSYEYSERILRLDIPARRAGVTLITALGANPGMPSVLMLDIGSYFDVIENAEILFAMGSNLTGISVGGLKELKYMFETQPLVWNGKWSKPRSNGKSCKIGPPINRKVYFGAAITRDMIILPDLIPIRHLACWSGVQSTLQSMAIVLGLKLGLSKTDRRATWFLKVLKRLGQFKGATSDLVIRVIAQGHKGGIPQTRTIEVIGDENYLTAVSPTIAVLQMLDGLTKRNGAFVAPQALIAANFVERLAKFNVKYTSAE